MKILNRIGDYLTKLRQDTCIEHDELQNLWCMQGYCIYCGKKWQADVTKVDIERELYKRRTEEKKEHLQRLKSLTTRELQKLL